MGYLLSHNKINISDTMISRHDYEVDATLDAILRRKFSLELTSIVGDIFYIIEHDRAVYPIGVLTGFPNEVREGETIHIKRDSKDIKHDIIV